jgi:hypothetical protein
MVLRRESVLLDLIPKLSVKLVHSPSAEKVVEAVLLVMMAAIVNNDFRICIPPLLLFHNSPGGMYAGIGLTCNGFRSWLALGVLAASLSIFSIESSSNVAKSRSCSIFHAPPTVSRCPF